MSGVEGFVFQQIVNMNWDQAIYTASPNNTINVAQFAAKGSGTNIAVALTPKGTGYISAHVPDGTAAGGNARGTNSFDFQTIRTAASQVASGAQSAIFGGARNTATFGVVVGGTDNISSNSAAAVVGGDSNTASGARSFVAGGATNTANGSITTVIGSNNSTATGARGLVAGGDSSVVAGSYGAAIGAWQGTAHRQSMLTHASGMFAAAGDAQQFWHELRNKTTNATETELFLNGSSIRLVLLANTVIHARVMIVGSKSDGSAVARYDRQVTIKRVTNTTSLVGSVVTLGTDEAAGTSIAITADDTNEALKIAVTGIAAETWRWIAIVHGAELGIGA